jgi:hypothetical protein
MELLKAQSAISELLAEYDLMAGYANKLQPGGWQPWVAQDQAQAEASASAYLHAAHVVARHFDIRLKPQVEGK